MSIRDHLPKRIPFISIRDALLVLAAAEELPFEAVAKFMLDRIEELPDAFYLDPMLNETEEFPLESLSDLLQCAAHYSNLGVEYDETRYDVAGPFEHEFVVNGWRRNELAAWLMKYGVTLPDNGAPATPATVQHSTPPSTPEDEIVRRLSTAPDGSLLTVAEVCQITGLSRATVYRKLGDGSLTKKTVGRSVRIPVGSVRRFIADA